MTRPRFTFVLVSTFLAAAPSLAKPPAPPAPPAAAAATAPAAGAPAKKTLSAEDILDSVDSDEILSIPPDARLTFTRNSVESFTPVKHAAERNEGLRRGHRVNTLDLATAEVTFVDDSRLQLGEHTLVVILGSNTETQGKQAVVSDTTLVNGSLRVHLADLAGVQRKPIGLRTPSAEVKVGAGESQVSVDDNRTTRVAVYHGKSKLRAGSKEVDVPAGFGSKAEEGKAPSAPKLLPAPPVWVTPPPSFLLSTSGPPEIKGSFAVGAGGPPPSLYHVQFARDERMNDLLLDTEVPATVNEFTVKDVQAGHFYARVSAIDLDQFEGKPSETVKVVVGLATLIPASSGRLAAADVTPGLYCSVDSGTYLVVRAPIRFVAGQAHTLTCAPHVDGRGGIATTIPDTPVQGIRITSKPLPMHRDDNGATQDIVFVLSDGPSTPIEGAQIVPTKLPFGVTIDPVVPSGAIGRYATTARYLPGTSPIAVHFVINGADEAVVMLSAEDGKITFKAPDPALAVAAPKRIGGELALFAAGHLAGSHPSVGGGIEAGIRVLLGKVSVAFGLRGAIDQYIGDFADQTAMLGLPISLRIGGPTARFTPYIGMLPQLVAQRSLTSGGSNVHFGYGGFIGGLLRLGGGGLFLDLGFERAISDRAGALNSFFALAGYRITPL